MVSKDSIKNIIYIKNKEDVKMNKCLVAIGIILVAIGVKLIYDARPIVKMYFSFGEENEAVLGLKILGFISAIIGRDFALF